MKPAAPKSNSSTAIPAAKASSRRTPASGPEIVASSSEIEVSRVRQRVSTGGARPQGLSLQWKMVIAMAGITVATALMIFIVVYNKAVDQLEGEIDDKGVRLVKTLSLIDPGYWKFVIYDRPEERKKQMDAFMKRLSESSLNEVAKERLLRENPEMKALYDLLVTPLGPNLSPLRSAGRDRGPGSEIVQMSVVDITTPDGQSVSAVEAKGGVQKIHIDSGSSRKEPSTGVSISDGSDSGSGTAVRLYTLEQAAGTDRFRYNVILSLERINAAKGALRTLILLPVFLSVLLGVAIAIWISRFITEPIKHLMRDMQEVSGGNLEHQTRPVSSDEVGLLAVTFGRMTEALRGAHQQELEARALEHDLSIASEIQSNLVPKRMLKIPGYDISAYYRPSKEVGGDYYDFITIDDDNEGLIVADVSGKGVPGSLVMTMARAFIRMEAERSRNTSPSDTLIRANRMLAQDIKKGMFVTALYCILNKRTNEMRVASAGHNPLIVWRAASNKVELANPNGIALGFDKGPVFERTIKEERIVLGHGDRIVAYTDGTVEAMNAANQEFGDKRFHQLIQQLATRDSNQMLNLLVKTLDEHKGDAPQSDDITIVTLRYL
jgi:sigma-B regulation protein RsbU (phosphoserine phosphatase)